MRERKKEDGFSDTVFVQNLSNLLWEYSLQLMEVKESFQFICKEMDQVQQIQRREQANSRACIVAEVARSLLSLSDDLSRIRLAAEKTQSMATILDGMDMVIKETSKAMEMLNIEKISPVGNMFDPHEHELGGIFHVQGLKENQIIEVIRAGYRCGDQWIRHPLVVVNQCPESHEETNEKHETNIN